MPGGDRTGPMGMGARTVRAAGYCAGSRGRRNMFYATGLPGWMRFGGYTEFYQKPDPEMERQALKNQAEALQSELDFIKKRMGEIETKATTEQKE